MKRLMILAVIVVLSAALAWSYTFPLRETITFSLDTRNDTLSDADTVSVTGATYFPLRGADAMLLRVVLDGPTPAESGLGAVDSGKIAIRTLGPVNALVMDSVQSGALPCTLNYVINNLNDTLFKRACKIEYTVYDTSLDSFTVSGTDTSGLTVQYKLTIDGDLLFDGRP